MIKAIIFDMDGTVIDSTEIDYCAMQKIFKEHGVIFSYEEYIKVLGAKGAEIVKMHLNFSDRQIDEFLEKKETYFKNLVIEKGIKAIPYIEKVLAEIKKLGLKTALATGGSKDKFEFIFERINLKQYFDAILTADDVKSGKPDPEIFLKAAKKLNVNPEEACVFEDAELGVRAAKDGGMKCVAITSTRDASQLQAADFIIDSYKDFSVKLIL